MCDMTHLDVWHDSFRCVTWLIHMCDLTHSCVRHDSVVCVTWLTVTAESVVGRHCLDMTRLCVCVCVWCECGITRSCVWHDSSMCVCVWCECVAWLIHVCNMTHYNGRICPVRSPPRHDSSTCVCETTVWNDLFICMTWLICVYVYVTWVWHDSLMCVTWLIYECVII